ncbi:MAG: hypothetical protein RL609_420 [Bacteroidota bacterium]|jgi:uncharacterized protein (TIGR02145 family)
MKHIFYLIFAFWGLDSWSQAPLSIPYQAVVRNADGSVMANAPLTMTFKIHEVAATGNVVYQETHAVNSNAQGLVVCAVGSGTAVQGTFDGIQWGSGAKFMQVLMNPGSGEIDLGTQQLMSVPYALYSNGVHVNVSATGDTLTIGGSSIVVPGISAANPAPSLINGGIGSQVLPGNTTCTNQYISVTGCGGQTSLFYDGLNYDLVEIGGQCWFADNLATDQYRNGDLIATGLDNASWMSATYGAYDIYTYVSSGISQYDKLYNWFVISDTRGVCPVGWHVPSDCEWMYLENSIGISISEQTQSGLRGEPNGGKLKSVSNWDLPNVGATNQFGFSAIANGYRDGYNGYKYQALTNGAFFWTSSMSSSTDGIYRIFSSFNSGINRIGNTKTFGHNIRCLKD